MENKDMMMESNIQANSIKSGLYKLINELERLVEGQTVIREDIADNKQQTSLSFKQIQDNLNKGLERQARLVNEGMSLTNTSYRGSNQPMTKSHIQLAKKDTDHSCSVIKDSAVQKIF